MRTTTLALAATFALSLTGAAFAQTPAGNGRTEGNMNNPGSVKSDSEKGMERTGGGAATGMTAPAGGGAATTGSTSGHSGGANTSGGGAATAPGTK